MYGYNPCDFDPALSEARALQSEAAWEAAFQRRWERARAYLMTLGNETPSDDEIEDALDHADDAAYEAAAWDDECQRLR